MKPGKSKWIQKESLQNISNKIIKTSKFFNSVTILDRIFGQQFLENSREIKMQKRSFATKFRNINIQMTLEQHGFEPCGSIYMEIFFNKYTGNFFGDF